MSTNKLDLSIVVTCRNDDHGGDMLRRARFFANGLAVLARKHDLRAELVFIDWNPLEDRAPLSEAVAWDASGPLVFRFIQVPHQLHARFRNADTIAVHQMIAKNVGIRRARAPFILATNVDLLFSDKLVEFLAKTKLDKSRMYRIDRLDVPADIPELSIEKQLEWCEGNIIRSHIKCGGAIRANSTRREKARMRRQPNPLVAHTNASGDFTLMSKEAWGEVRGYLELPFFCLHLDGLLCIMAIGHGLEEEILKDPMRIYHIDHTSGWATLSMKERLKFFVEKPWLDYSFIIDTNKHIVRGEVPDIRNDQKWGLIYEDLPELILT